MVIKTKSVPKCPEEALNDRLILEKLQDKLKVNQKCEILEKINEQNKGSNLLLRLAEITRKILKLAPTDPEDIVEALERLDSFVSSKGTNQNSELFNDVRISKGSFNSGKGSFTSYNA